MNNKVEAEFVFELADYDDFGYKKMGVPKWQIKNGKQESVKLS